MAKYDSLTGFLKAQTASELPMSFRDVEQVVGAKLPPSAYRHRPWWANEAANHVHAKAWLNAGYRTEHVDMQAKKLIFKRLRESRLPDAGMAEPQRGFKHEENTLASHRHPILGVLKGLLTIEPGYDLTQPAMPEWADMLDEKYGPEKPK